MNAKSKAMLSSYARSAFAAVLAVVSTGNYSPEDLAKSISEEFGVQCSMEDINNYYSQHIVNEDYELESRRQEYGITMQC